MPDTWNQRLDAAIADVCGDHERWTCDRPGWCSCAHVKVTNPEVCAHYGRESSPSLKAHELLRQAHVLLHYADSEGSYMSGHHIAEAATLLERAALLLPADLAHEARALVRCCDKAIAEVIPHSWGLEEAASALLEKVTI